MFYVLAEMEQQSTIEQQSTNTFEDYLANTEDGIQILYQNLCTLNNKHVP